MLNKIKNWIVESAKNPTKAIAIPNNTNLVLLFDDRILAQTVVYNLAHELGISSGSKIFCLGVEDVNTAVRFVKVEEHE